MIKAVILLVSAGTGASWSDPSNHTSALIGDSSCPGCPGGKCDCSWTKDAGACSHSDGSCCWNCCCKSPSDSRRRSPGPSSSRRRSPSPSASGSASTTRYWDCSKPTCAWCGKCKKAGDGDYAASWNQLFKGSDGKLYGTAATCGSLGQSNSGGDCKHCYELIVKDGSAKGKTLTVMATNFCPDQPTCPKSPSDKNQYGEHYHFDIAIPGGGVGKADKCDKEYGSKYDWKVNSKSDCTKLPTKLQSGCKVWWEELGGMDNPKVDFKKVSCPSELSSKC